MHYEIIPVTPFQQNCTVLWCTDTRQAVVVDPGGEPERIQAAITEHELEVHRILLTHGHLDHVGGAVELGQRLGVPILGPHMEDRFLLQTLPHQCEMFRFPPVAVFEPDRWLEAGETIEVGDSRLEVLHCPGHTPGHLAYFDRAGQLAMVGDVLFRGSIGRTDFPRGDLQQLLHSIRDTLLPLGDDVRFIPGHGPLSTFGVERRTNPYLQP